MRRLEKQTSNEYQLYYTAINKLTFIPIPFWNGSVVGIRGMVVRSSGLLDVAVLFNGVIADCFFESTNTNIM